MKNKARGCQFYSLRVYRRARVCACVVMCTRVCMCGDSLEYVSYVCPNYI